MEKESAGTPSTCRTKSPFTPLKQKAALAQAFPVIGPLQSRFRATCRIIAPSFLPMDASFVFQMSCFPLSFIRFHTLHPKVLLRLQPAYMIGTVSMLDIFLIILLVDNGINKIKQILCRYMKGRLLFSDRRIQSRKDTTDGRWQK